jgi:hypothetical protein
MGARLESAECTPCENVSPSSAGSYRVGLKYRNGNGTLVLYISARIKRAKREQFLALACKLSRDFSSENDVSILIFDSEKASKRYQDPDAQHKDPNWRSYAKSFKAFYTRKPEAKEHWIVWGFDPLLPYSQVKQLVSEKLCLSP